MRISTASIVDISLGKVQTKHLLSRVGDGMLFLVLGATALGALSVGRRQRRSWRQRAVSTLLSGYLIFPQVCRKKQKKNKKKKKKKKNWRTRSE